MFLKDRTRNSTYATIALLRSSMGSVMLKNKINQQACRHRRDLAFIANNHHNIWR